MPLLAPVTTTIFCANCKSIRHSPYRGMGACNASRASSRPMVEPQPKVGHDACEYGKADPVVAQESTKAIAPIAVADQPVMPAGEQRRDQHPDIKHCSHLSNVSDIGESCDIYGIAEHHQQYIVPAKGDGRCF